MRLCYIDIPPTQCLMPQFPKCVPLNIICWMSMGELGYRGICLWMYSVTLLLKLPFFIFLWNPVKYLVAKEKGTELYLEIAM